MRADLKSCTLDDGAWAFAFIPDFGNTSDFHWTKCMRQRGWDSGWGSNGVRVYTRAWTPTQEPLGPQNARRPPADGCQPGALWNEVQETCMTIEPSPAWCRGTWTGVRCIR